MFDDEMMLEVALALTNEVEQTPSPEPLPIPPPEVTITGSVDNGLAELDRIIAQVRADEAAPLESTGDLTDEDQV